MSSPSKGIFRRDPDTQGQLTSDADIFAAALAIVSSVGEIENTDVLLKRLLEQVLNLIPADHAAVLRAGRKQGELETAAFHGSKEVNVEVTEQVLRDGAPLLIHAPASVLCVPLRAFDSVLGLLYFESPKPEIFHTKHLQCVMAVATVAAMALDRLRSVALLEAENERLRDYAYLDEGIVGNSAAIQQVRSFINKVAGSDSTVLILGESGTGKELVARAIHRNSRRARGPFVAINCAAIQDTLIESELFGHERGAFSGAVSLKKGKIEAADEGTLFLDEVGELSLQTQAALLRFLQEREYQRVGGTDTRRADVRIVAATNRDLEQWIQEGRFRHDLYYRLQVVEFRTPSLFEIREDIPRLADHFLERFRFIRRVSGISAEALRMLSAYDWPGNVRQLQNAIEQALVLGRSEFIQPEDLPPCVTQPKSLKPAAGTLSGGVDSVKRKLIERTLAETKGNITDAARVLEVSQSYLSRLIRKLQVKVPE